MKLNIGDIAPKITLLDQHGKPQDLAKYKGQWVLVYFYPKDDTTGCTIEACSIRDGFPKFGKLTAVVLGISADSVASHKKFADKYALPFLLLSDEAHTVLEAYGVWAKKKFMGREYLGILRTSFLIDPKGRIAKIYEQVKPPTHAGEVLADLEKITSN